MMTSFLSFHAAAAARGEGLRPELLALYVGVPVVPHPELTLHRKARSSRVVICHRRTSWGTQTFRPFRKHRLAGQDNRGCALKLTSSLAGQEGHYFQIGLTNGFGV